MSGDTIFFLGVRVLHVVLAGLWLGVAFFVVMFLMPVVSQPGPAGGQILTGVVRRGIVPFMASIGGTTILTGIYLFWRFTGGFDPVVSASRMKRPTCSSNSAIAVPSTIVSPTAATVNSSVRPSTFQNCESWKMFE